MEDNKRRAIRTSLDYTLTLTIIKAEHGRDFPPFDVDITDVSKTGIGFRTDNQLMIGEMFHGILKIWTKQRMEIVIKIIRSAVEEEGYSYGSIFVGMKNNDTAGIEIYQMLHPDEQ